MILLKGNLSSQGTKIENCVGFGLSVLVCWNSSPVFGGWGFF